MIRYDGKGYKYTLEIDEKELYAFLNSATNDASSKTIISESDSIDLGMFINSI